MIFVTKFSDLVSWQIYFFLLFPSLLPILSIYSHDIGLIVTGQDYETIVLTILATLSECCEMRDRMDGVRIGEFFQNRFPAKALPA
jgi:hypothetical protein